MRFVRMAGVLLVLLAGSAMAQAPTFQPVGTIHQIMLGIVKPASDVIFAVPNHKPKTEQEWAIIQNNALTLAEAGNLLMLPGRAKDNGEWIKDAKSLVGAGSEAFTAANAKDAKALEDIGDKIEDTCEACHAKYLPNQSK
jgi:hypothetical protein